jgi:hypothetical protein
MVRVTTVHMEGGENHEHIARVRWTNPQTGDIGQSTREQMIEYLRKPGTRAFVTDGERTANIRIVEAEPPYIRTHADGRLDQQPIGSPTIRSHVNSEPAGYQRPAAVETGDRIFYARRERRLNPPGSLEAPGLGKDGGLGAIKHLTGAVGVLACGPVTSGLWPIRETS